MSKAKILVRYSFSYFRYHLVINSFVFLRVSFSTSNTLSPLLKNLVSVILSILSFPFPFLGKYFFLVKLQWKGLYVLLLILYLLMVFSRLYSHSIEMESETSDLYAESIRQPEDIYSTRKEKLKIISIYST